MEDCRRTVVVVGQGSQSSFVNVCVPARQRRDHRKNFPKLQNRFDSLFETQESLREG